MPKPTEHKQVELPQAALDHMSQHAKDNLPDHIAIGWPEQSVHHVTEEIPSNSGFFWIDFDSNTSGTGISPSTADVTMEVFFFRFGQELLISSSDGSSWHLSANLAFDDASQIDPTELSYQTGIIFSPSSSDTIFIQTDEGNYVALGNTTPVGGLTYDFDWAMF